MTDQKEVGGGDMISRSIAMPSHRGYKDSFDAIHSARQYAEKTGCELKILDNSGSQIKSGFDIITSPKDSPMMTNFYQAFINSTGDYVLMAQDDDLIFSISDIVPEGDCIGIQPTLMAFTPQHGILKIYSMANSHDMAQDRVIEYMDNNNGSNLALFSFWRRDILASVLDLWCNAHPTKGAYADWAVVNALMSSGKVIRDVGTVYFKNIDNWAGDQAACDAESKRLFTDCGYEHMAGHSAMLHAIDSFIMVARKDSPVSYDERIKAALSCMFPFTFEQIKEVMVVNGLFKSYCEFYEYAVGKKWGRI